jgi:hypothetical protein
MILRDVEYQSSPSTSAQRSYFESASNIRCEGKKIK